MSQRRTREYINALRDRTPCAICAGPMFDWHNEEHVAHPDRRVGHLVNRSRPLAIILAEIATCIPLCRRCHMAEDHRMRRVRNTRLVGERNPKARLTEQNVLEIRRRAAVSDINKRELEREFRVSRHTIANVISGRSWKHL